MQAAINEALDRAEKDSGQGRRAHGQSAGLQRRLRPRGLPVGRRASGAGDAGGRLRAIAAVLDVPETGDHRGDGPGHRDGLVPVTERRPSGRAPKSRCQAIEVAIGMTIPLSAIEIMRLRLTPAAFQRGTSMAATFVGDEAIAGGWLDEIVEADQVLARAQQSRPRQPRRCTRVRTWRPSSRRATPRSRPSRPESTGWLRNSPPLGRCDAQGEATHARA